MFVSKCLIRRRDIATKVLVFDSCVRPLLLEPRQRLIPIFLSRKVSSYRITKNLQLFVQDYEPKDPTNKMTTSERKSEADGEAATRNPDDRTLLIMFRWLMSKPKHIMKFANLYLDQGFDVITVSVNPWQLLRPATGSRAIAAELLLFLMEREHYQKILLHGFSVGGYLWGEALNLIENDRERYGRVVERIVGQVWDSIADVKEVSFGTPRAIFPKSLWMQNLCERAVAFHMNRYHDRSTRYYLNASRSFHQSLVRAPALLFVSKTDPVGTLESNLKLRDCWESIGIETRVKVFEASPHVGHFRKHPNEYLAELYGFLDRLELLRDDKKLTMEGR